jgi:hypothetical protein
LPAFDELARRRIQLREVVEDLAQVGFALWSAGPSRCTSWLSAMPTPTLNTPSRHGKIQP